MGTLILRRGLRRKLSNYRGAGEVVPFGDRTLEWGVVIATFLAVLRIVPRDCARLTDFLPPNLREINAVLIDPKLITFTLRRPRCARALR